MIACKWLLFLFLIFKFLKKKAEKNCLNWIDYGEFFSHNNSVDVADNDDDDAGELCAGR